MDTLATEPSMDLNQAADGFAALFDDEAPAKKPESESPAQPEAAAEPEAEIEAEPEGDASDEDARSFTIVVDGKEVTLSESELAEAYKSGLRQSDYTRKTTEVAEQRKAVEAEITKAREERQTYAQRNAEAIALLSAQLTEQQNTDWAQLLKSDPIAYLEQQRTFQQRQADLQNARQAQQYMMQQAQVEQQEYVKKFVNEQQEQLLAKLPEWKDVTVANTEKKAISEFLSEAGYTKDEISNAADHRMVVIARDAMRFREMMAKAKAASKKVENVPNRVQRPATGAAPTIDKRSLQYQRLAQSGSIDDAAKLFASIL